MPARATPFELVFGGFRDRFDAIRAELEASGRDPRNRDEFLMREPVAGLLRDLRPEEGLGEAMMTAAALVHHAYLFWSEGERVREISSTLFAFLVEMPSVVRRPENLVARPSEYVQLPALALWGRLESGPPEPVDGWFRCGGGDGTELTVLAILGFHAHRAGLTAVEVSGTRPDGLERADGSAVFAPIVTDTGARAGVASVSGEAELLELAWRVEERS